MGKVRVAGFGVSIDGFGAGPDQSLDHPLGKRGTELHGWFIGIMVKQTDLGIQQLHAPASVPRISSAEVACL